MGFKLEQIKAYLPAQVGSICQGIWLRGRKRALDWFENQIWKRKFQIGTKKSTVKCFNVAINCYTLLF